MNTTSKLLATLALAGAVFGAPGTADAQTSLFEPQAWFDFFWSPGATSTPANVSPFLALGNYRNDGSLAHILGANEKSSSTPPSSGTSSGTPTYETQNTGNEGGEGGQNETVTVPEQEGENGNYQSVPEPSTLLLLTLGIAGLVGVATAFRSGAAKG